MNRIIRIFAPQNFFFCRETDIKWAPGNGKQADEGGTVGKLLQQSEREGLELYLTVWTLLTLLLSKESRHRSTYSMNLST